MISFNYADGEAVSSPTVIVSGSTRASNGLVIFTNNNNEVFPPACAQVNNGQFKAIVHVSPGANNFQVNVVDKPVDQFGFVNGGNVIESGGLRLQYSELDNKPVHLCVIMGRDSAGQFDMPAERARRGDRADLPLAVARLKVAARLMQAYTQDEFKAAGLSNRTFQFVQESVHSQAIFGYSVDLPRPHAEVKVHVIRSPKSVAELRDRNWAQQNKNATNSGGLFSHAIDLINKSDFAAPYKRAGTAVQCAVVYLDAHWDGSMILAHAALGGGTGDVKLAIFGSHGVYSWPRSFAQVGPLFLDATPRTPDVANDANECGTAWECFNVTCGAFLHEIGHLLGLPHQVDGVMLRDYVWWNRSFMTAEAPSTRTKSSAQIMPLRGWPRVCHWNRLDLVRYLYHGSFSLPIDEFGKNGSTVMKKSSDLAPTSYVLPHGTVVRSDTGIFMVEFVVQDLARHHWAWYPRAYGSDGVKHELVLDYDQCYRALAGASKTVSPNFAVRVLSLLGDLYIKDFKEHCHGSTVSSDFGLGRGTLTGYKSVVLGKKGDKKEQMVEFNVNNLSKVRVYHGGSLDGMTFYMRTPPVPPRNYLKRLVESKPAPATVTIGNQKSHYTDFEIPPGDQIKKFHFRNGAWIDAVQFELALGKKSPFYGNASGGHLSTLEAPSNYTVVGMFGYVGSWMDAVGIIYTQ